MDLYHAELENELRRFSDVLDVKSIRPPTSSHPGYVERKYVRYVAYAQKIKEAIRKGGGKPILHVTDQDYAYLCRKDIPSVVTCHDIAEYKVPSLSKIRFMLWRRRIKGMKNAQKIVAVSMRTAEDISESLGISPSRVVVNYEGIGSHFRPVPINSIGWKAAQLEGLKKNYCLLMHVGSNIRRKNIPVLMMAVTVLKQRGIPVKLVKVGNNLYDDGYGPAIAEMKLDNDIIQLGRVTEQELVELYNTCDVFLFPSKYEGFGRPLIEAQACGIPCIVSNSSCLREIGGEGAAYHDADDPEEIADNCLRILTDSSFKQTLIIKGQTNARKYTPEQHAIGLVEIYKSVLS
jgi:glycosyltransferase involved in cell wall biosynthesis